MELMLIMWTFQTAVEQRNPHTKSDFLKASSYKQQDKLHYTGLAEKLTRLPSMTSTMVTNFP
jgi:hypothetical protein